MPRRVDANQAAIVRALRGVGVSVIDLTHAARRGKWMSEEWMPRIGMDVRVLRGPWVGCAGPIDHIEVERRFLRPARTWYWVEFMEEMIRFSGTVQMNIKPCRRPFLAKDLQPVNTDRLPRFLKAAKGC